MANISMDPRPTNYLRQNIVFSYPEMIRVSFSLFLCLSVFCYFTLLLIFIKIVLLLLLFYLFIFMKMFFFHVPGCSGMFRNVPACSGMFHVPDFIDGPQFCHLKLYLGRETVSCCLLQRMARISNGLKHGRNVSPTFFKL